jgi:hypothetical protein
MKAGVQLGSLLSYANPAVSVRLKLWKNDSKSVIRKLRLRRSADLSDSLNYDAVAIENGFSNQAVFEHCAEILRKGCPQRGFVLPASMRQHIEHRTPYCARSGTVMATVMATVENRHR